jgi:inosine triphosphate pyrophosphatase
VGLNGLNRMLEGFEDKSAYALCIFGLYIPGRDPILFEGRTYGRIVPSRGPTTFGWDSIFQPDDFSQTYAEMSKETKNSISHRYKALAGLKKYLNE